MAGIKTTLDDLAIFGGPPLFSELRPIGQLAVPTQEAFLDRVKQAYDARRLSNDSPQVRELEERLAEFHGVRHCIALANAGLGLMMLMQILAQGRSGQVIMPAFTFRGLPHFARWAGQTPCFCDVDPVFHMASAASVETCITPDTTVILAVCNFNGCGNLAALEDLADQHGIPLLLDSVYGIGSHFNGRPMGSNGMAEVFSLHATKLINGFEGGYVTTDDSRLAAILRQQRNFCFPSNPDFNPDTFPWVYGLNAKLNEVHAALALATLDELPAIIARNRDRHEAYRAALAGIPGLSLLPCTASPEMPSAYLMAIADVGPAWGLSRDATLALLRQEGCALNPYYSPPLHQSPHGATSNPTPSLPVTEDLAGRYLQLPAGDKVSRADIDAIGALLRFVAAHRKPIAARLEQGDASR
jgi:dTDP-4-amino-4,6-dideoxygalactose transaminase